MELILLILAALAPAAVLIYYIYRRDKYQKEPVKELLKAFGLGILSIPVSLFISTPLESLGFYSTESTAFWGAVATSFFGAAIPEEIAKFLMLWILVRKNRCFDERIDGIVYASIVSLGFAAIENILYLLSNIESWAYVGATRALFSVPGHFFFGVLMGYYYSLYRFCPQESKWYRWLILGAPILAHGIFDTVLFVSGALPSLSLLLTIAFIILCNSLRKRASRSVAEHLARDMKDMEMAEAATVDAEFGTINSVESYQKQWPEKLTYILGAVTLLPFMALLMSGNEDYSLCIYLIWIPYLVVNAFRIARKLVVKSCNKGVVKEYSYWGLIYKRERIRTSE